MDIISNIDLTFDPMRIPIVKGRLGVENITSESYPVLVTSNKRGAEIIIREGHVFTLEYPYLIMNTQFRYRFKELLRLTTERHFTLHATVTCPGVNSAKMQSILTNASSILPNETSLYVTLALYETSTNHTPLKDMVTLLESIFGKEKTPFMPRIFPANYNEANSKGGLADIIDVLARNPQNKGVLVLDKNGKYLQGKVPFKDANAVILDPTEEAWGIISKINTSVKYLPGETLVMADELLIRFGETELQYNLSQEPLMIRGFLAKKESVLVGTKILCENLYLPGKWDVKINRILNINY